jgi:cobalt/nickel transport system permease protein
MHVSLLDIYQPRNAFIHRLDPRVKLLLTLCFILTAMAIPEGVWGAYLILVCALLSISWMSKLGLVFTIQRGFIALPFVLAALPLPFLTPGEVVFVIPGLDWTVSDAGLLRFITILLRTWIAVQAGVLLSATTSMPEVLWGLSQMRVPRIIVAVIGFMVRYLFVLADEALRMVRARTARSPVIKDIPHPGIRWQGRTAGKMVGSLFLRSLERSERVYAAMLSRGYDGELRVLEPSSMNPVDWGVLVLSLLFLAATLSIGLRG